MRVNQTIIRFILGIKVRKHRTEKGYSLDDLSKISGLSRSYINDIEQGKKYPQADKMFALAQSFNISYDDLVSLKLDGEYAILNEMFLSNRLEEIPLSAFGLDEETLFQMFTKTPKKAQLLLNNIINLSLTQGLSRKNFLTSASLSYKETYSNHFEHVETEAQEFRKDFLQSNTKLDLNNLIIYLKEKYNITTIDEPRLNNLFGVDSVLVNNKNILLLHPSSSYYERKSAILKEIYYRRKNIKKRMDYAPAVDYEDFNMVLNEMFAKNFALAALMNWNDFKTDLQKIFAQKSWPAELYNKIKIKYDVDDVMVIRRMGNLLKKEFGFNKYTITNIGKRKDSDRYEFQLELKFLEHTRPYRKHRNFCRKGIATSIVRDNIKNPDSGKFHVQTVRLNVNGFELVFFEITAYINSLVHQTDKSINLMVLMNDAVKEKIHFLNSLPAAHNGIVCESCSLPDCEFRDSEPTIIKEQEEIKRRINDINKFIDDYK